MGLDGSSKKLKLAEAYAQCATWAARSGKQMHLKAFTAENLNWKAAHDFPELPGKASDCVVVLEWLQAYLGFPWRKHAVLSLLLEMTTSINAFYALLWERALHGPWLDSCEANKAKCLLETFVTGYSRVSVFAYEQGLTFFNVRPKLHYLDHIRRILAAPLEWHANPMLYARPRDEDFVGRMSRISRRVHALSASLNVLRRYLIKARRAWRARQQALAA